MSRRIIRCILPGRRAASAALHARCGLLKPKREMSHVSDDFADEAGFTGLAQTVFHGHKRKWTPAQFTVLYDGGCPLCVKEIAHYQRINATAKPPFGRIKFLNLVNDNSNVDNVLGEIQVTREEALRRMHVVTEQGQVVKNADAFVEMWKRLPYWRAIVPLCSIPGAMPVANWAYEIFAEKRIQFRETEPETSACHLKSK